MYVTTFKHVPIGQRFKVIWGTDEQPLLPPQTTFTKVVPATGIGGAYNATTHDYGTLEGVNVADGRAVPTWREERASEPLAELAPDSQLAWAQN